MKAHRMLDAAPLVAELLGACQELIELGTTPTPLDVSWEQGFPIAPLEAPSPGLEQEVDAFLARASVRLLIQRMAAVGSAYGRAADDLAAVAATCRGLDLNRSYELLSPTEQRLFRHLGVFVGGCTIEAAAQLCETGWLEDDIGFTGALASVVDCGLVSRVEVPGVTETRLVLQEPVREYALELLTTHGEAHVARRRHAAMYLTLLESIEPDLQGRNQHVWLARLDREQANALLGLRWLLNQGEVEQSLRLATAMAMFWWIRGFARAGLKRLKSVLALPADQPTQEVASARAYALVWAGLLSFWRGEVDAEEHYTEGNDLNALLTCKQLGQRIVAPFLLDTGAVESRLGEARMGRGTDGAVGLALEGADADGVVPDGLTPRESEVLRLLAGGHTNKEIASKLTLSVATVERHISNMYAKIGARGRTDATAYAITRGLASLQSREE